ncbi:MAG: hypothetical protein QCI38_07455 [Candidatus Thermoplasmatota archaeon]|nr:hypothetical protein [Candidatus Thermoplasmatota archaeon]
MDDEQSINMFDFEDWKRENDRVVSEAQERNMNFDPYPRSEAHVLYAEEMFNQFPVDDTIEVQIAYLLKNMICAQRFEFGNKRTARNMVVEFARINGYELSATAKEWIRICTKIQRKVPKQYVIREPNLNIPERLKRYILGTGGGYAVKIENIPMGLQGSSWYNPWIIRWIKEHLQKVAQSESPLKMSQ